MNRMPSGWRVDVTGAQVVVRMPDIGRAVHHLTADDAETLSWVLRSACALASRQEVWDFDPDDGSTSADHTAAAL
jgi:hypothetical protein